MENLFDKNTIIPRAMKKMGIYGDYILENRGDISIQSFIKEGLKIDYCYTFSYMKDWGKTKRGRLWWLSQSERFNCVLNDLLKQYQRP